MFAYCGKDITYFLWRENEEEELVCSTLSLFTVFGTAMRCRGGTMRP
jgi:hypothetical protein